MQLTKYGRRMRPVQLDRRRICLTGRATLAAIPCLKHLERL